MELRSLALSVMRVQFFVARRIEMQSAAAQFVVQAARHPR